MNNITSLFQKKFHLRIVCYIIICLTFISLLFIYIRIIIPHDKLLPNTDAFDFWPLIIAGQEETTWTLRLDHLSSHDKLIADYLFEPGHLKSDKRIPYYWLMGRLSEDNWLPFNGFHGKDAEDIAFSNKHPFPNYKYTIHNIIGLYNDMFLRQHPHDIILVESMYTYMIYFASYHYESWWITGEMVHPSIFPSTEYLGKHTATIILDKILISESVSLAAGSIRAAEMDGYNILLRAYVSDGVWYIDGAWIISMY